MQFTENHNTKGKVFRFHVSALMFAGKSCSLAGEVFKKNRLQSFICTWFHARNGTYQSIFSVLHRSSNGLTIFTSCCVLTCRYRSVVLILKCPSRSLIYFMSVPSPCFVSHEPLLHNLRFNKSPIKLHRTRVVIISFY